MSDDTPAAITAGDPPGLLPSELLEHSGVAAWIIRPEDLDRLHVLTAEKPPDPELPYPPDPQPPPRPLTDPLDPYRTPDGQVGPDTHVTLSYRELRRLVALHLEDCAHTMPRDRPWLYARARARAMSDGEMPLRLREVME